MKKIIGIMVSLSVMAGAAFAKVNYMGDVQLHLGVGLDATNVKQSMSGADIEMKASSAAFDIDVASWNLFGLNDMLGVGFMVGLGGGFGAVTNQEVTVSFMGQEQTVDSDSDMNAFSFRGLVGPAVGINVGDIVRVNVALGLSFGVISFVDKDDDYSTTMGGVGFGAEAQAKLFPKKRFSPVAGYRFAFIGSDKYTSKDGSDEEDIDADPAMHFNNEIYVGAAFNF